MTLSVVQPTDQELNARWPYWIRTLAAAINGISPTTAAPPDPLDIVVINTLAVAAGDITLEVGVDLSTADIEVILISGIGEAEIAYLIKGISGQLKIFIAQDDEVSFLDGVKNSGKVYLNQPALTALNMEQDDVIAFVNIGGDGSATYGYWKELWRDLSVK